MKTRHMFCFVLLVLLFLALLEPAVIAHADVSPPPFPPGATIGPDKPQTQVRMVSEVVTITVHPLSGTDPVPRQFGIDHIEAWMKATVEATFVMRNLGDTDEAFDVWFPLGAPSIIYDTSREYDIQDFAAWVDGQPSTIAIEPPRNTSPSYTQKGNDIDWYSRVPWATWPVRFPVGKDVILRATYTQYPDGSYRPTGDFRYVLQTGAGWKGTIGEGTIIFKLPYSVSFENAAAYSWKEGYEIRGDQVIWHFKDLEPTSYHNITLCVVEPARWLAVVEARKAVTASPESAAAQFQLGVALNRMRGTPKSHCAAPQEGQDVRRAWSRVFNVAPLDRREVYDKHAKWLMGLTSPGEIRDKDTNNYKSRSQLLDLVKKDFEKWPDDPIYKMIKGWLESPDIYSYVKPLRLP